MVRPTKAKKRRQDNAYKARHARQLEMMWLDRSKLFDDFDLSNTKGRSRTESENKIVLMTLKLVLNLYIEKVQVRELQPHELSWTLIENRVADGLQMRREQVSKLRHLLFESNSIGVFGDDDSVRGNGSPNAKKPTKLTSEQVQAMVKEVDNSHNNGSTVSCNILKKFLLKNIILTSI
jgi:hypothetical protein